MARLISANKGGKTAPAEAFRQGWFFFRTAVGPGVPSLQAVKFPETKGTFSGQNVIMDVYV